MANRNGPSIVGNGDEDDSLYEEPCKLTLGHVSMILLGLVFIAGAVLLLHCK